MSRTLKTLAEQLQTAQSERHYAQIIADHIESLLTPVKEEQPDA